jgi:hypothetical protein
MRPLLRALPVLLVVIVMFFAPPLGASAGEKLRVIMETDLGGDADDQASLVRFLLYSNEWDVEGILADRHASSFHKDGARDHLGLKVKDGWEMAQAYVEAYGRVQPNLALHKAGYPAYEEMRRRTVRGFDDSDEGVNLLVAAADRDDPRPIWYGNWGSNSGTTSNLRRALDRVRKERAPEEYKKFVGRFRVVTLDGSGPTRQQHDEHIELHVETGYPTLEAGRWYHRFRPLTERVGGCDTDRDIRKNHGALAALYTTPKEGDSWTFVYLIPNGLSDPREPTWGGWGGRYGPRAGDPDNARGPKGPRFYWANQRDTVNGTTSRDNTVSRFAAALQNDFRARLDWCVAKEYKDANHEPVPHCQGDGSRDVLFVKIPAGQMLELDARGTTDPDGNALAYRWWVYGEAGTYVGKASLEGADQRQARLRVPTDAAGKTLHVILEVTDDGEPPLTRYRRIVVTAR